MMQFLKVTIIRSRRIDLIIAPQAQLEESANDRGKPEVLFNRDVRRIS